MADKPKKPNPAAEKKDTAKAAGGGLLSKTPMLMGGAMIIEAVVLFSGFKFLGAGAPHPAQGAELVDGTATGKDGDKTADGATAGAAKTAEVQLVDFKAPNKQSGRTFLYDVSIYVTVKADDEAKITDQIKDADALIRDRIRTIIAESDPDKLGGGSEPGLETFRRQVKFQLDQIFGPGLVQEVLVPRCIPYRTDY